MKKLLLLIVGTAFSMIVFAQNARFGVTAGATFSSIKFKVDDEDDNTDSKPGFTLGVLADVPLTENFSFRPGLNFTQKGGKQEESEGGFSAESKISFNYLELPLNFVYNSAGESGRFFIGLGPALNYGLSGKTKYKVSGGGFDEEDEEDIEFGNDEDEDDFKAFEFSGNVLAGYELSNGVTISANYNMGLSNLAINGDDQNSAKNRYFGIRIGYMLGAK